MRIDLHTHSTYSDGTLEPEDLILCASKLGITHLALSDHDSTGGLEAARLKAKEFDMTVISAIEINTIETNSSVHILGYFIDENNQDLQNKLNHHRQIRETRAQMIIDKLRRMGIKIALSDFNGRKEKAAIGRPHIADKLKEKGIVFSRQEAFDKYLSKGRPAYIIYEGPSPQDAIDTILACKGIPVLAHPGYFVPTDAIVALAKMGLQGIETYYPSHKPDQIRNFIEIAKQNDLVVTGGSDYHGPGSGHEAIGEFTAPEDSIEKLLQRKAKLFG